MASSSTTFIRKCDVCNKPLQDENGKKLKDKNPFYQDM